LKPPQFLLRLAGREYLPMAGSILTWAAVAAVVGHADAVRLMAASLLVRAARTLTMLDVGNAMRRREGATLDVIRTSLRRAMRIEAASFVAGALVVAAMIAGLQAMGQPDVARMTALIAIGLPARYFAPARGARRRGGIFSSSLAWSGLALVGLAGLAGEGVMTLALAIAAREWIALAIVLAPAATPSTEQPAHPTDVPLTWQEVAGITARRARHRLTYRIGKSLLGVLGPFGNVVARTARGFRMHRRADRFAPKSIVPVALLAAGTTALAFLLPVILQKPATLLGSASLLRIAAAAGNVLLWWSFTDPGRGEDGDDDEEDD
jgi:hypothetical protein